MALSFEPFGLNLFSSEDVERDLLHASYLLEQGRREGDACKSRGGGDGAVVDACWLVGKDSPLRCEQQEEVERLPVLFCDGHGFCVGGGKEVVFPGVDLFF